MAKIKFVKSKSLADAKTASASDSSEIGIYFPSGDSEDTIVMGGKEYGKSVTAVDNHYTPTANSASQLSVDASGGTATSSGATTQVVTGVNIQRDAKGHVTGVTVDSKGIKDTVTTNTDTLMTQTATTANANYPLLLSSLTSTGTRTGLFDSGVTLNPSTNTIAANISGKAESLTYITANNNNKNNYPYHRFASLSGVTGTWSGKIDTFLIQSTGFKGHFGIFSLNYRTQASGEAPMVQVLWLARYGLTTDTIQYGYWGTTGDSCYFDFFVRLSNAHGHYSLMRLGPVGTKSTLISSLEVADTTTSDRLTSVECYSSLSDAATQLHGGTAYTKTGTGSDVGVVSQANIATTAGAFSSAKKIALTGDVTGSDSGTGAWSIAATLANSGVTAGTYGPSANVSGSNGSTISVPQITVDAKGRVTSVTNRTYTSVDHTYTIPTIPTSLPNPKSLEFQADGTTVLSTTGSTAATLNFVAGSNITLTPDSSSKEIQITAKDTTYSAATTSANGLMSSSDKTKLNGIATGAEVNQNALAKITVGSTTLTSSAKQGNLTIANGTGISLALDTTNSKLTITNTVTNSDTKNTAGSTDTSSKIFLIGATSQAANPQTYSQDTAYVGTDGCLYSGGAKVLTSYTPTTATTTAKGVVQVGSNITVSSGTISLTKSNVTSALGYTPPSTVPSELPNPETLTIQVNGTDLTSYSGAYSDTVNLKAGSNVTLSASTDTSTGANTITINSSYSTTATKLGTSTVGGAAKPIYLNAGTATACSSTVGSGLTPVYMSSGTITASTSTKGSATKPVFLSSGTITEGSTYAGGTAVTLNGTAKGASTASFYAPTSAGTDGYFLTSSGSGAPSWTNLFGVYSIERVKGYQQATITATGKTQGLYVECETTYINTIQGFTLSGFWSHTGSSTTPEYGKEYKLIVFNYTTSTNTLTINGTFGLSSHTVIYNGVLTSGSAKTVSMGAYTYHKFTINVLPDSKTGTTYIFIDKDLSWQ